MRTLTIKKLRGLLSGEIPEGRGMGKYSLYVFRDKAKTVFYVGMTSRHILDRLNEHMDLTWGTTLISALVLDNLPESDEWRVDLYALEEIIPDADERLAKTSLMTLCREAELVLINRLHPALNTQHANAMPMPDQYVKARIERAEKFAKSDKFTVNARDL